MFTSNSRTNKKNNRRTIIWISINKLVYNFASVRHWEKTRTQKYRREIHEMLARIAFLSQFLSLVIALLKLLTTPQCGERSYIGTEY